MSCNFFMSDYSMCHLLLMSGVDLVLSHFFLFECCCPCQQLHGFLLTSAEIWLRLAMLSQFFFTWEFVSVTFCNWHCCSVVDEPCYPYTAGYGFLERCRLPKRSNLLTARCKPPPHPQTVLRTDLYRVGPSYRLGSEQDIMYEIMESGPVQGTSQHLEVHIREITNILA